MLEDSLHPYRRLYEALPSPLATPIGACYRRLPARVKFGPSIGTFRRLLDDSETWDAAALEEYQWAAVHGVQVGQLTSPVDLAKLPFVTKQDVREHAQEFVSVDARPRDILPVMTSGSAGEPFRVLFVRGVTRSRERAFIEHLWRRVGYREGARVAMLRARLVRGRAQGRLWRRDATRNRWAFSTFDMTSVNCHAILAELQRIRPEFLHVFPSALTTLCAFMATHGKAGTLPSVRAVLAGSENLYPWQCELIREALGESVKVMRWHGLGEQASLAGSCELSQDYHVFPQYSYAELLRGDGIPAEEPGEVGEIIGTTFDNWVMPLIRYRTADRARRGPSSCACGRPYQLWEEVDGRTQSWAITAAGDRIPFTPLAMSVYGHELAATQRFQFVQREPGVLDLWLVPWPESSRRDISSLVRQIRERVAPNFELRPHIVDSIEERPGGKHEYMVQQLEGKNAS
jgi:phenylacetate-CoA ligase